MTALTHTTPHFQSRFARRAVAAIAGLIWLAPLASGTARADQSRLSAMIGSAISSANASETEQDDYDRLDGTGASGKKVHVVEWEGNLEIHVYPGGSLKGLALKLDKRNKDKPVMVIGYRFNTDPSKQLIRRAILGIDLHEGFKAYRDPSPGPEYDKIIISNNGQSGDVVAFHLDPEPTQLYPDGHPALAQKDATKDAPVKQREPASGAKEPAENRATTLDDDGTIQPFYMRAGSENRH